MRLFFRYAFLLLLILANIGCDRLTKNLVRERLEYHEQIPLMGEHLLLTKVENSGAFLSLGDEWSPVGKTLLLNILPLLVMAAMLVWLFSRKSDWATEVAVSCIIGGGIGNIFDRIAYGSVTDFLYLQFGILRTGIFNFADVSITFGALFIIAREIWKGQPS